MSLRLVTDERVENTMDVATEDHVCRKPDFNAMVETCPACPSAKPDGVIAEAGEKPFRHVVASRWVVHHLLQFHYLPFGPRNANQPRCFTRPRPFDPAFVRGLQRYRP